MLKKIIFYLLLALLFLLPWQTRWIYAPATLNGGYFEYGTLSLYGTEILMWLIILLSFAYLLGDRSFRARLQDRERWRAKKWRFLLGAGVVVWFSASALSGLLPDIASQHWNWVVGGLCLAMLMLFVLDDEKKRRSALMAVWSGGAIQGLFAIWQFLAQYVPANKWLGLAEHYPWELGAGVVEANGERVLRAYGSLGGPNPLGIFLAVIFVLGLILYFSQIRWRDKIIISVGQIFIAAGLFFTFSRGAFVSLFVGGSALAIIFMKRRLPGGDLARPIFYAAMLWTALCLIYAPLWQTRLSVAGRLEAKSLVERGAQIEEAWSLFIKNPLVGVGQGNYAYGLYQSDPTRPVFNYQPAHNSYLLMLVEIGLIGLIVFALLYGWLFAKIAANNELFLPVILALMVGGLFDHWLWSVFPGMLFFWTIWGLGLMWIKSGQKVDERV